MKIITYKCDICGSTYSEDKKSEYVTHLKKHAILKKYIKETKLFCSNNKQLICMLFEGSSEQAIQDLFILNHKLIIEYILRKYFLSNISTYNDYSSFIDILNHYMCNDVVIDYKDKCETEDAYYINFIISGDVFIKHIHENNFGNGTSIKFIKNDIILILKKPQHSMDNF